MYRLSLLYYMSLVISHHDIQLIFCEANNTSFILSIWICIAVALSLYVAAMVNNPLAA